MVCAFTMVMILFSAFCIPGRVMLQRMCSKMTTVGAPRSLVHTKLPRLYLPQTLSLNVPIQLPKEEAHYISNVMRLKSGSLVRIFNEKEGEFVAKLTGAGPRDRHISLDVLEKLVAPDVRHQTLPCVLFIAPIKKTRMKILLEKAVELGIQHIVPVNTQNTQHTIEPSSLEQYKRILIQSCEQCERITLPKLHNSISMDDFIVWRSTGIESSATSTLNEHFRHDIPVLVCAERMEVNPLSLSSSSNSSGSTSGARVGRPLLVAVQKLLQQQQQEQHQEQHPKQELLNPATTNAGDATLFGVMVGPEGGFTAPELNVLAAQRSSELVSLGSNVLRAETAVICALSTVASAVQANAYRPTKVV